MSMSSPKDKTPHDDFFETNDEVSNMTAIIDKLASRKKKQFKSSNERSSNERGSNDEIKIDDVEFDKLNEKSRKIHTDLFSGMMDVYLIMGCVQTDTSEEIKKKCTKMLAKYHPDKTGPLLEKCPVENREREKKRLAAQYNIVREAYKILTDPAKRKFYDLQKKTIDSKNFLKQKSSFDEFIKLQESEISEKSKKLAENQFKLGFESLDKKHGFDRKKLEDKPFTKESFDKKLQDLQLSRDNFDQDLEFNQKNIFEGKDFDPKEFNKAWGKQQKKQEKRARNGNDDKSVVKWDGLMAGNIASGDGEMYVSVDGDYGELYRDNTEATDFAGKLDSCSEDDNISISSAEIDDRYTKYSDHNKNKEETSKRFEEYMKRRKQEDTEYDERKYTDKDAWKCVTENPMNISSQMGEIIGNSKFQYQLEGPRQKRVITQGMFDAYEELTYGPKKNEKRVVKVTKNKSSVSNVPNVQSGLGDRTGDIIDGQVEEKSAKIVKVSRSVKKIVE